MLTQDLEGNLTWAAKRAAAIWVLVTACGGPSKPPEPVSLERRSAVEPRVFSSHTQESGSGKCKVDGDCGERGERANTKNTLCYHGDFCLPLQRSLGRLQPGLSRRL